MTSKLTPAEICDLYKRWTRQDARNWTFRLSDSASVLVEYCGTLSNPSDGALGPWHPMLLENGKPVWFGIAGCSLAAAKARALKHAQANGHSIPVPTPQQSN